MTVATPEPEPQDPAEGDVREDAQGTSEPRDVDEESQDGDERGESKRL